MSERARSAIEGLAVTYELNGLNGIAKEIREYLAAPQATKGDARADECKLGGCNAIGCDGGAYCGNAIPSPVAGSAGQAPGEWVGYYWIGSDNRQKFCGSYDTIDVETANRAQKVYIGTASRLTSVDFSVAEKAEVARVMQSGSANAVINTVLALLAAR